MKIMKIFSFLLLAAMIALGASCTKAGPIGPAGTNGIAGTNGTNGTNGTSGTNGTNGTNGKDGNANVKSVTINILAGDWLPNTATSSTGYFFSYSLSEITADISSKGIVMGYLQASNGSWLAMPWTNFYSGYSKLYNYAYGTGYFQPQIKDSDLLSVRPASTLTIKVVIIAPSGIKADVDITNYLAVRRGYNLDAVESAQQRAAKLKTEVDK